MARIDFYHLQRSGLEETLPKLLEKVLGTGLRAVVVAASAERVEALDSLLWSGGRDSWLPHGSRRDGHPDRQPVWLTDEPSDNLNRAEVLVLTDGMDSPLVDGMARTLDIFDGRDETAVEAARARWSARKAAGHELHYWRQDGDGHWSEQL